MFCFEPIPKHLYITLPVDPKQFDTCLAYTSANGQFSGFEILTCKSGGVIYSSKFDDEECKTKSNQATHPDAELRDGSCAQVQQGAFLKTSWEGVCKESGNKLTLFLTGEGDSNYDNNVNIRRAPYFVEKKQIQETPKKFQIFSTHFPLNFVWA